MTTDQAVARAAITGTETRRWAISGAELRDDTDTGHLTLTGYASVFDKPYEVEDMFGTFTETVLRGAFRKTLAEHADVQLLLQHEGLPLARTKSGTLALSEDTTGLRVYAELDPADPDVQTIRPKMERGDLDEMSFAFRTVRQEWDEDYTDRKLIELNLNRGDVSVVRYGASPWTSAGLRSLGIDDVTSDTLDAAFRALAAGTASEDQIALAARAADHIVALLPDRDPNPEMLLLARLWDQRRIA